MKKLILLIGGLFMLGAGNLYAQRMPIGIRAGLNVAKWGGEATAGISDVLDNQSGFSTRSKTGFHFGVYSEFKLTPFISVEPGLFYSNKGFSAKKTFLENTLLRPTISVTDHAHYIDVPLSLKVYPAEGLYFYAGPQVSFLVSNRMEVRGGILGLSVGDSFRANNGFRKIDVGIAGGMGYKFENGFNIQAGYDYGLSTVDDAIRADVYNRVVKVSLGFNF